MKKIKFGNVSIEFPDEFPKVTIGFPEVFPNGKFFKPRFSRPTPAFFKDLFTLTHSSFSNYLQECANYVERHSNQ